MHILTLSVMPVCRFSIDFNLHDSFHIYYIRFKVTISPSLVSFALLGLNHKQPMTKIARPSNIIVALQGCLTRT